MRLNPSLKYNLVVGAFLSLWVFILSYVARPFDHGHSNDTIWLNVSYGFSLLVFICYAFMSILQRQMYKKLLRWNLALELICYALFYYLYSILAYLFYMSPIIDGYYNLIEFVVKVIFKSALIFVPVMFFSRQYLIKLLPIKEDIITIRGENKLDILRINKSQLVGISNAQNYVEVFFIEDGVLQSKLIRTSLKKMRQDLDFLIQIHRSHLINPSHFLSWKNSNTILLTKMELPVSKTYKEGLPSF